MSLLEAVSAKPLRSSETSAEIMDNRFFPASPPNLAQK